MKKIIALITLLSGSFACNSQSMQFTQHFHPDSSSLRHIERVNWKPGLNNEWPVLPLPLVKEIKEKQCKHTECLKKSDDIIKAEAMINQLIQDSEDDENK